MVVTSKDANGPNCLIEGVFSFDTNWMSGAFEINEKFHEKLTEMDFCSGGSIYLMFHM